MSSCNRSSSANKSNVKNKTTQGKSDHHSKSSDSLKNDKLQKSDQLRNTHIIDNRINNKEDMAWQERIKQVMELTRRTEDEVIMALHDSDNDLNRAVNDLLEGVSPEWEVKKKKARQSQVPKSNSEQPGGADGNTDWDDKRLLQHEGSTRVRGRANPNNRGLGRRRENKENEKNIEDTKSETNRGGPRRGRGISGRSGRGGRGGGRGLGPRTFANRGESSSGPNSHSFTRPIDTWTGNEEIDSWTAIDASEDWDNEEYTGSLADTKVFTPSTLNADAAPVSDKSKTEEMPSIKTLQTSSLLIHNQEITKTPEVSMSDQETISQDQTCQPLMNISSMRLPHSLDDVGRGTLSAAQSEYFNQLTQQANDCLNVASGQNTFLNVMNSQPQRQSKHRPRVPPPSKIPSSAVEMPGDALNNSISFLDVQFGALEFGTDTSISEGTNQDKYNSGTNPSNSLESSSISTKAVVNSISSLTVEATQASPSQKFSTTTKMLRSDNQCMPNEHSVTSQGSFTSRSAATQPVDMQQQDLNAQTSLSNTSNFNATVTYQSPKPSSYPTSVTASNYSAYSCNAPTNQTSFTCPTTSCNTNSYSSITPVTQTGYSSAYTQSGMTTFSQTPSSSTSGIYNQTSTTSQGYQSTSGFTTTPISQYQSQTAATTNASTNSSYITSGYQSSSTFQTTTQSYQPSNTTFTSSISQGSSAYSNAVQSVYSNTYPTYGNQTGSQDHKLSTNKDLHFENTATTTSSSLVTTAVCTLGLTSSSVNTSQTKPTMSNAVPKSTVSGLVPSSSSNTSSISGSGTTGNIAPILSHQYIMGQSVPYATFQQPHMYSYEDLQLMQQRMPHMPTTGYYDATLGYQTTGPVTSLGNSRSDALSGVQGVQAVQGQYTSINDARFARTDSNASPVSSTMSQQTATQHQQPLMNPIPPGYAYFYGGGIMQAGGFQYGTPAMYPQIATAGSAGTTSGAYNAKPGSYGSTYGSGTNYDTLTNTGPSGDYKSTSSGYNSNQSSKNGSSSGNTNTSGTSTDINTTMYTKGHVALNKVNSYEKQTFHSATPPPFNNQNANVISGYGAPHLFIPTVHHQLHQPLHQDSGSSTGQRTNTNSQNKAQVKPGYSTSYWAGGN